MGQNCEEDWMKTNHDGENLMYGGSLSQLLAVAHPCALCGRTGEEERSAPAAPGSRIMRNNRLISSSSSCDPTRFPPKPPVSSAALALQPSRLSLL